RVVDFRGELLGRIHWPELSSGEGGPTCTRESSRGFLADAVLGSDALPDRRGADSHPRWPRTRAARYTGSAISADTADPKVGCAAVVARNGYSPPQRSSCAS